VIARGANLEAIKRDGIHLEAPDYSVSAKVTATDKPQELGPQDFVLVSVKSPALPSIVDGLKPLIGPNTAVAFVMNGVPWWYFHKHGGEFDGRRLEKLDPGGRLWDVVSPEKVIGGVIFCSCDLERPGTVHTDTRSPKILLGEPSGEKSARVEKLAALLRQGPLQVNVVDDIRRSVWLKLQANMCSGLIGCLSGCAPADAYGDPACAQAVHSIANEVGILAKAMGWEIKFDASDMVARSLTQHHKSSILQDLEKGRPMEIDPMFGIPLELGKMAGVATPTLDMLVALVKARARKAGAYEG
jgi:2-dehydropantoate 2-reductase